MMWKSKSHRDKRVWLRELKSDQFIKYLIFFLNPFLGFCLSLRRINSKSSYLIFFLTALCFGASFSVLNVSDKDNDADGSTYRSEFENFNLTPREFYDGFIKFLNFEEKKKDYFVETLSYVVKAFTANYHFFFMIVAIIFAFFSLKSLRYFTSLPKFDTSYSSFILLYIFGVNQIVNINGLRFWLAGAIAVYLIFKIFVDRKFSYAIFLVVLPFIHGAYWIFLCLVLLSFLCLRFTKGLTILFFLSFILSSISMQLVQSYADFLPEALAKMALSYADEGKIQDFEKSRSGFFWVADIFKMLTYTYINFLVYLFIKNSKMILADSRTKMLFGFLLFFMIFVNFTMPIPSVGNRFILLAYPLIAYIWLLHFKDRLYNSVLYVFPFVFILNIYNQLLLYKLVTGMYFFISPFFYIIYEYLI